MPDSKHLGRPEIVDRADGERPEIALTFDDGPSPWTTEIAAVFEDHGCRATFFLRGPSAKERPADVGALADAGHELGNHLWSHRNASAMTQTELQLEISRTADAIENAGGGRPNLLRPPYLKGADNLAGAAMGGAITRIILRSAGTSDWLAQAPEEISEPLLARVVAGDIVCLHDGISPDRPDTDSRKVTAMAVRQLVPTLLDRGLRPVTISQLLR